MELVRRQAVGLMEGAAHATSKDEKMRKIAELVEIGLYRAITESPLNVFAWSLTSVSRETSSDDPRTSLKTYALCHRGFPED